MKWSANCWQEIIPVYLSITKMPFIKELMDGTLALPKFQFYMAQDSVYLEHFGRALSLIAARAPDVEDALTFIRFAEGAIVVENALHQHYFREFNVEGNIMAQPACHHYVHFLKSTAALEQVEVAMAAVLPCFWIYKEVGDYIYQHQLSDANPYQRWIDTYAGEDFANLVEKAIGMCDRLAEKCTPSQQEAMTKAFVTASRLEYEFWEAAYQQREWRIS